MKNRLFLERKATKVIVFLAACFLLTTCDCKKSSNEVDLHKEKEKNNLESSLLKRNLWDIVEENIGKAKCLIGDTYQVSILRISSLDELYDILCVGEIGMKKDLEELASVLAKKEKKEKKYDMALCKKNKEDYYRTMAKEVKPGEIYYISIGVPSRATGSIDGLSDDMFINEGRVTMGESLKTHIKYCEDKNH